MDFRIQPAVDSLVDSLVHEGDFDRIAVAGGAGNTGLLFYHLDLSQRLHHPDTFILIGHEDCGYGATKEDLMTNFNRVRVELPNSDTVRAFWISKKDGSTTEWEWNEVFLGD